MKKLILKENYGYPTHLFFNCRDYSSLSRMIQRNALDIVIGKLTDILPNELRKKYSLSEYNFALENIHFPKNFEQKEKARKRLVFEELLILQLGLLQLKNSQIVVSGIKMQYKPAIDKFISQLPYQLTNAQQKVFKEIVNDMTSENQMNRLIQGDVGSGENHCGTNGNITDHTQRLSGSFMVPTGILAEQHYQTIKVALKVMTLSLSC